MNILIFTDSHINHKIVIDAFFIPPTFVQTAIKLFAEKDKPLKLPPIDLKSLELL